MTDELARKYEELKLREAESKEKKEQDKKALKKGCLATIQIALVLFLAIIVLAVFTSNQDGAQNKHQVKSSPGHRDVKTPSPRIKRRTSAGVPIERGADIDYRIDSDKLINLSVKQIRLKGHSCNSLSSIDLYNYNKSIVVRCNGGKDKYRIYPASGTAVRE